MADGIKIPISADLDKGDLARTIADFNSQMNRLGDTIAKANKMKFSPVDKAGLEDLKKVVQQFEAIKKINPDLRRRLNATGQGGSGFQDVDWGRVYPGGQGAHRVFNYVGAGTQYGGKLMAIPATPPGGGHPGGGGGGGGYPGQGIVNAGLNAAGPFGGVAARSINAGMSGGIGAGVGAMLGGLAALAVGKAVSAVREKVSAAENEFIGYDTLKRQLGDRGVSFGAIRASVRAASRDIDVGFDEGGRLAGQFVRGSGGRVSNLHSELSSAGGFARSFGLDPSEGVGFMATMRRMGATKSADDSKRMGLLIGEGIAKSGAFAQAGEMLQAVANYATLQTRSGMGVANVVGYTGMLSGAVRSGIPGLDVGGASNILGTVNSSIAAGGRAGEAGQNFMLAALGRRMGLNPVQTMFLQEQGAFGTGAGTFGHGSTYAAFAEKFGGSTPKGGAASRSTNLQDILAHLVATNGGQGPDLLADATSRMLGINHSQAAALHMISPEKVGGVASRLSRLGIPMGDIKSSGISALGQIESSNLTDEQKDAKAREIAKREQESTPGSESRRTREAIENLEQEIAGKMVPLTTSIRDGVLFLAGGGKKSPGTVMREIADTTYNEQAGPLLDRKRGLEKALGRDGELRLNSSWFQNATPEKQAEIKAKRAAAEAELAKINSDLGGMAANRDATARGYVPITPSGGAGGDGGAAFSADVSGRAMTTALGHDPWLRDQLLGVDKKLGLPAGTSAAMWQRESGYQSGRVSSQGAMGLAQIMPEQLAVMSKRFGRDMDPNDPKDALAMFSEMMTENVNKFGADDAVKAYHGGWNTANWGGKTNAYDQWVKSSAGQFASPMLNPGRGSSEAYASIDIRVHRDGGVDTKNVKAKFNRAVPVGMQ